MKTLTARLQACSAMGRAWLCSSCTAGPQLDCGVNRVAAGVRPLLGIAVASGQDQPQLYSWIWGVGGHLLASVS